MTSHRKELKLGMAQRDHVNLSVKAQDQILRATAEGILGGSMNMGGSMIAGGGYKTTDDLLTLGGPGATTQYPGVSKVLNSLSTGIGSNHDDPSRILGGVNKSTVHNEGGDNLLLLPSIKSVRKQQASPFKGGQQQLPNGFFDMPMMLATQKMMRQTVRAAAAERSNQAAAAQPSLYNPSKSPEAMRATHSADRNQSVKMNPKVLETWINETLQDAEHLDIPGVILKPEHKNPISRYGIDRLALTNAGIPNELVDRIFRALFVYSVGFYELVKKCLQHTERKYSIITAIWKVFSILLEYCCKTDYRMLISEISKEHKDELDRLEREFQQKFGEQAANERILKQNMEILQKYTEELEKEKNSERQMRLKLEEEYMQNTKNHEEEVQLRLKFESKLNNMHSVHRDLETKYKRALSELAGLQTINEQLYNKNNTQSEEITQLKTTKAEMESKISYNDEKIAGLQREVNIKVRQVQDLESKFSSAQDDLDLTKYKLQELQKDLTEQKLKIDVYESQVIGLKNEKQHLLLELKETKDLQKVYEKKCGTLISEVNKVNLEFQESKREIIGFGEIQKEREERIEKLKTELRELKINHEDLDLRHGTLNIQHEKVKEQYETAKRDLDDAIDKLHVTNKVRHETELKLSEETERARSLQDVIRDKDEQLHKRAQEIEDMDRRVIDLERTNEQIDIKKASLERQHEIMKKQLNEKINNLNEILQSEKETREMWIERYEKEQKEHTQTNANLLHAKSQLKDQILATKNVEIKLQTTQKANEVLFEQNARLQDQLNDSLAKEENLERDVNTQKEIMKQMEQNRKEYIQKLKSELLTVESRFHQKVEQAEMVAEDFYSRAAQNVLDYEELNKKFDETKEELSQTKADRDSKMQDIALQKVVIENRNMGIEDLHSLVGLQLNEKIVKCNHTIQELEGVKVSLEEKIASQQEEIEEKVKLEAELHDLKNELIVSKTDLVTVKKEREKLQSQISQQADELQEQKAENERQAQVLSELTNKPPGTAGSGSSAEKKLSQHRGGAGLVKEVQTDMQMKDIQHQQQQLMQQQQQLMQQYQYQQQQQQQHQQQQQLNPQQVQQYQQQQQQQYQQQQQQRAQSNQHQHPQIQQQQNSQLSQSQQNQQNNQQVSPQYHVNQNLPGAGLEIQTEIGKDNHLAQTMMSPYNQTQAYTNPLNNGDMETTIDPNNLNGTLGGSILTSPMAGDGQFYPIQSPGDFQMGNGGFIGGSSGLSQPMFNPGMSYPGSQLMQGAIPEMQAEHEEDRRSPNLNSNNGQPQQYYQPMTYPAMSGMSGMINNNQQMPLYPQSQLSGMNPQQYQQMPNPMFNNNTSAGGQYQQSSLNFQGVQQQPFRQSSQNSNQFNQQPPQSNNGYHNPSQLQQQNSISQVSHNSQNNNGGAPSITRAPSNRMQVEFKNMNTVMQHQPSQASQHSNHSNHSNQHIGFDRKPTNLSIKSNGGAQGVPVNMQQQQYQQMNMGPSPMMMQQHPQGMHTTMINNQQVDDYSMPPHSAEQNYPQQQTQLAPTNTRMKVDITSSYATQMNGGNNKNNSDGRRNLNSGGAMSVHTPMSQVSGYSNHLAPSNNRFSNQPPGQTVMSGVSGTNGVPQSMMGNSGGMQQPHHSPLANAPPGGISIPSNLPDKKVTGKSSIRTLIKAAATRDQ